MSDTFDPYHKWLGIPPEEQPPHHYRLLGITLFEADREVIEAAANRQMSYLQELSSGAEQIDEAQKLLGEVSRARVCLLNAEQKNEYDAQLREELRDANEAFVAEEFSAETATFADGDGSAAEPPAVAEGIHALPGSGPDAEAGGRPLIPLPDGMEAPPHTTAHPRGKKQNPIPLIVLAVVALVLVGGGLAFYLTGEAKKQEQQRLAQVAEEKEMQAEVKTKDQAAAKQKAKKEADRKAKEAAEQEAKQAAARQAQAAADKEAADKEAADKIIESKIKQMGVEQVNNANIWQTEQLAAFYEKENTLSKESSAADLKEAETLLDAARKKQAELSADAQAILAQLDEQYRLRPVPKNAATVLKLRSGAKQTLEAKGLIQVEGGKNTWTVAPIFDLKQLEDLTSQSKPKWTALEPLLNQYFALQDKSRDCHNDDDIKQSLDLLGEKLNEVPSLPKEADDKIKELADKFLKSNKLLAKDTLYRLNATEKKIRNIQLKIARDQKKQSRTKKAPQIPANINQLVEDTFKQRTKYENLMARKRDLEKIINTGNYGQDVSDEYKRIIGMDKGIHKTTYLDNNYPPITAEQVKKEIREELENKWPELVAKQRAKKTKTKKKKSPQETLEEFQRELHDNYEKLRKDPQVTLALTVVGGELPPEETNE